MLYSYCNFIIENLSFGASVAVFLSWARQRIIAEGDLIIRLFENLLISLLFLIGLLEVFGYLCSFTPHV